MNTESEALHAVITVMVPNGGIATVGKGAGAPVADACCVVGVATEYPCRDPAELNPTQPTGPPPSDAIHHRKKPLKKLKETKKSTKNKHLQMRCFLN